MGPFTSISNQEDAPQDAHQLTWERQFRSWSFFSPVTLVCVKLTELTRASPEREEQREEGCHLRPVCTTQEVTEQPGLQKQERRRWGQVLKQTVGGLFCVRIWKKGSHTGWGLQHCGTVVRKRTQNLQSLNPVHFRQAFSLRRPRCFTLSYL